MRTTDFEMSLSDLLVEQIVADALSEDLSGAGDLTTDATVPDRARATGVIAARKPGFVAGLQLAAAAFEMLDPDVAFEIVVPDGGHVGAGDVIARVEGQARALLTAERTALNFLGHLSGIATLTSAYVEKTKGTRAKIVDTRKTTPGLRAIEKYAVRAGGGFNHRHGLFDAILIKDNHIVAAGGVGPALKRAKAHASHMVKIEVEVTSLEELDEALAHKPDAILLDNMPVDMLKAAVEKAHGKALLEASGGVNLDTVRAIAETGVDMISVGALTHSAPVLDIGLDFEPGAKDRPA